MRAEPLPGLDGAALRQRLRRQFRNLDANDPAAWPALPRSLLQAAAMALAIALCWLLVLSGHADELAQEQAAEQALREDFRARLAKAAGLQALQAQREQLAQQVARLEQQLPGKAGMAALLSDINQAGLSHDLQFEVFRPAAPVTRPYYVELPVALKVTGRYHAIGAFAADVAALSRIVLLSNLAIVPAGREDGVLAMEATARTFRYLEEQEIKAAAGKAPP